MTKMMTVPFLALLLTSSFALAPGDTRSELWSIDQSDSAGKTYGGTIYIWAAKDLEKVVEQINASGFGLTLGVHSRIENTWRRVQAVARVPALSRARCRQVFEERFSASRMAQDYVQLYRQCLAPRAGRAAA